MKSFAHKFLLLAALFCFFKKAGAQCSPSLYASVSSAYDCLIGQGFITFTLSNGTAPYTFTITQSSNGSVAATGTSASNTGSTPAVPQAQYNVYFADANGCTYNTIMVVNISYATANVVFATTSVSCYGGNTGSITITPPSSFSPALTYTWQPGGYNTPVVTGLTAGIYSLTVADSKGCQVTNTVAVKEPPPIVSSLTNTHITCFGYTMTTPFTSTGNVGSTSYTLNGVPMISSVATVSAGLQTIITLDSKGCQMTNTVMVSQGIQTTINFAITKPTCPGTSDGAISTAVSTSTPPYSYTWQPGNSNNATLSNIPTGTYTLILLDANGCITRSLTTVSPAISATVTAITSPENCSAADGSFTLNVAGVNPPFTFTTLPVGPHAGMSLGNLSSGTYTTITNYNSTCIDTTYVIVGNLSTVSVSVQSSVAIDCYTHCTGSVMLNVQNAVPPVTYSATGMPLSNTNVISNLCAGFYQVKVLDGNGCPATTTVNFVDPPQFTYSATAPATACAGQQVNLQGSASGGTGAYTFNWKPGNLNGQLVGVVPAGTTVYSLTAFDSKGCTQAPVQFTVSVLPVISVSVPAAGAAGICPGSTAQITPTVSGGDGNYKYLWLPGNTTSPGIFVENLTVPVYTLVVSDVCGSPSVVKLVSINLFPATQPVYKMSSNRGCAPFCATFINATPKSGQATWIHGDKTFEQKGDTVRYCYTAAGNYDLKLSVVDSNNCRAAYNFTGAIQVQQSPVAGFMSIPERPTLKTADNVLLNNTSEGGTSYQWYKGSQLLGETANIYYTFPDTGCYLFQLVARNPQGCTDTLEKYVCVAEDFNFYMPNCFTPNDNGLNDVLIPHGTSWLADNYLFEIYNRWGTRLFKTTEIGKGWDGRNAGASTPQNTFVWRVLVTDQERVQHVFQGSVTVLR